MSERFDLSSCRFVVCVTIALAFGVASEAAHGRVFEVGPGQAYERPSEVAKIAKDGDVVEIAAGPYHGDVAVWRQNHLTLRGVGTDRAHLLADGKSAEAKAIWVIKGRDATVEHIEFSGAAVPDGNGAGIRAEGPGLSIRDCYFHDNEDGVLGGAGDVLIERSEFAYNGSGNGRTHNLYISDRVRRFTLRYSYSHGARVGHNVKSRARENRIVYNRLMDENDGRSSYTVDLPDGGLAFLIGNLIQQGPRAENLTIVSYGAEDLAYKRNEIFLVNNTIVNDASHGSFVHVAEGAQRAVIINNLFVGPGHLEGTFEARNNLFLMDPKLVDRERFDYRLAPGSQAIDAGVDPGQVDGVSLLPVSQYVHPLRAMRRPVVGPLDVGAEEFDAKGPAAPRASP
jgi:hypothetical protein